MASNYGLHFGVRHLDEDNAIREGRFKTPAAGNPLLLGTCVEVDPANEGYMRQGGNGVARRPRSTGILIYEDQFLDFARIDVGRRWDTQNIGYAALNRYAVITSGAGIKVWFRNITDRVLPDGKTFPDIEIVVGLGAAGVDVGDYLGWNGAAWAVVAAGAGGEPPIGAFFEVLTVNDSAATLEAAMLA